ncbi:MAG: plasmid pRiA4b ORF-3 family protein [Bacteroidia bacterium]
MVYQLHIFLEGSQPLVWRRVRMPAEDATFADLAMVCLGAMGWDNSHLHEFYDLNDEDASRIGMILEDGDDDFLEDEEEVLLTERFNLEGQTFGMIYDMGDSWEHHITLEEINDDDNLAAPKLLGGANACPPEDVGGIPGYYLMVEALEDPDHESHQDMLDWLGFEEGETWDITEFDAEEAQELILTYWEDEEEILDGFMEELENYDYDDDDFDDDEDEDDEVEDDFEEEW